MQRRETDTLRTSEPGAREVAELLSLPARHLGDLPVETRIIAHHAGIKQAIVLTTGRSKGAPGALTFDGEELRALAEGVEADRLWTWDFVGFCLMKQHDPKFRVTPEVALAGAQPGLAERPWSLALVLRRLGVTVSAVELAEADSTPEPIPGVRAA